MNPQIEKLYQIAQKKSRKIIGLMSGTSLDGLDIALCEISGSGAKTNIKLLQFVTKPYEETFRNAIREVFAQEEINQQFLCGLNPYIAVQHAALINEALSEWQLSSHQIDLIASHGQTVFHAPKSLTNDDIFPNSTLQIGDGDHLAVKTNIITVSDFRQKHLAAGGEGAPLAAYGDFLLFTDPLENRILLNIGGISNITFLPNHKSGLQSFATDLGPGNTMMNQFTKAHFDMEMDMDAKFAQKGSVKEDLLEELLNNSFLKADFPKTTGPELFNLSYLNKALEKINRTDYSKYDILATLNAFSAKAISMAIARITTEINNVVVYVSGGGLHNPLLMSNIRQNLPSVRIESFSKLGIDPDAKEAVLFALLANETLAGRPQNVDHIKDSPAVCMGKISLPE